MEPPTPTRAPDNQFGQMQDWLKQIRNTSLLNVRGWVVVELLLSSVVVVVVVVCSSSSRRSIITIIGSGGPIPSALSDADAKASGAQVPILGTSVRLGNYQDVCSWFPAKTSSNVCLWFPDLFQWLSVLVRSKDVLWTLPGQTQLGACTLRGSKRGLVTTGSAPPLPGL